MIEITRDKFGAIEWQKFLEKELREYVVLFKEKSEEIEKKYKLPFSDVQKQYQNFALDIDDKYKLVLLDGWKKLAKIRGIFSVYYRDAVSTYEFSAVTCEVIFKASETFEEPELVYSARACAHFDNTYDFTQRYLTEMAENRAFVRAVRSALGVNILGKDEISDKNGKEMTMRETASTGKHNAAAGQEKTLENKVINGLDINSFDGFKNWLRNNYKEHGKDSVIGNRQDKLDAWREFESYEDVKPKAEVTRIIRRLNNFLSE